MFTKDVPIPLKYERIHWRKMEIGDSFLYHDRKATISHVSSLASHAGKRLERTFTCRSTEDGVRVWRIA